MHSQKALACDRRGVDAELLLENCVRVRHEQAAQLRRKMRSPHLVSFEAHREHDDAPPEAHHAVRVAALALWVVHGCGLCIARSVFGLSCPHVTRNFEPLCGEVKRKKQNEKQKK